MPCSSLLKLTREPLPLSLGVGSRNRLLGVNAGVVTSVGGPMRPAGRGVGVARMSPSRLLAFLFDDLFAFADTFDMRGGFPLSHMMPPFLPCLAHGRTRGERALNKRSRSTITE